MIYQRRVSELTAEKKQEKEKFDLAREELEKKIVELLGRRKKRSRRWSSPRSPRLQSSRLLKNIVRL